MRYIFNINLICVALTDFNDNNLKNNNFLYKIIVSLY